MAQRIRADFKIAESETESPEKELLRSQPSPEKVPSPISPPDAKGLPPPAPLVFTRAKSQEDIVDLALESREDSDSDWETIEDCESDFENDFPTIDVNSEDWAEKFTKSVQRFHNVVNCENCDEVFTPEHQC